jgi:hypothetical protein
LKALYHESIGQSYCKVDKEKNEGRSQLKTKIRSHLFTNQDVTPITQIGQDRNLQQAVKQATVTDIYLGRFDLPFFQVFKPRRQEPNAVHLISRNISHSGKNVSRVVGKVLEVFFVGDPAEHEHGIDIRMDTGDNVRVHPVTDNGRVLPLAAQ